LDRRSRKMAKKKMLAPWCLSMVLLLSGCSIGSVEYDTGIPDAVENVVSSIFPDEEKTEAPAAVSEIRVERDYNISGLMDFFQSADMDEYYTVTGLRETANDAYVVTLYSTKNGTTNLLADTVTGQAFQVLLDGSFPLYIDPVTAEIDDDGMDEEVMDQVRLIAAAVYMQENEDSEELFETVLKEAAEKLGVSEEDDIDIDDVEAVRTILDTLYGYLSEDDISSIESSTEEYLDDLTIQADGMLVSYTVYSPSGEDLGALSGEEITAYEEEQFQKLSDIIAASEEAPAELSFSAIDPGDVYTAPEDGTILTDDTDDILCVYLAQPTGSGTARFDVKYVFPDSFPKDDDTGKLQISGGQAFLCVPSSQADALDHVSSSNAVVLLATDIINGTYKGYAYVSYLLNNTADTIVVENGDGTVCRLEPYQIIPADGTALSDLKIQ
jgi:hypothetical protein